MTDIREARKQAAIRWFVLAGGMSAFALHLLAGFYLVPVSCALGSMWPLYAVTAAFAAVAAAATVMGWRRRRSPGPPERRQWAPGRGAGLHRVQFMIHAGIFLSALGLLIILYAGASMLVFDPCLNRTL